MVVGGLLAIGARLVPILAGAAGSLLRGGAAIATKVAQPTAVEAAKSQLIRTGLLTAGTTAGTYIATGKVSEPSKEVIGLGVGYGLGGLVGAGLVGANIAVNYGTKTLSQATEQAKKLEEKAQTTVQRGTIYMPSPPSALPPLPKVPSPQDIKVVPQDIKGRVEEEYDTAIEELHAEEERVQQETQRLREKLYGSRLTSSFISSGTKKEVMPELSDIQAEIANKVSTNPAAASAIVGLGAGLAGATAVGLATRKKHSRKRSKRGRKASRMKSYRKARKSRRKVGSAKQYRRRGGKSVKYTKSGQPYIIMKSGKARFIKK